MYRDPHELTYDEIRQRLLDIYAHAPNPSEWPEYEPQLQPKPLIFDRIQAEAADDFDANWFANLMPKEIGELGERGFDFVAGKRRIATAEPHGENIPFDLIAIIRQNRYKLYKIQVRCSAYRVRDTYRVNLTRRGKHYVKGDFDFFAAWIVPEDLWYIVPWAKLPIGKSSFYLHPHGKMVGDLTPLDRYRERWDLLR